MNTVKQYFETETTDKKLNRYLTKMLIVKYHAAISIHVKTITL